MKEHHRERLKVLSIYSIWMLIVVSATSWVVVGSVAYWIKRDMLPPDTSSWVQSFGSLLALVVAVGVPLYQNYCEKNVFGSQLNIAYSQLFQNELSDLIKYVEDYASRNIDKIFHSKALVERQRSRRHELDALDEDVMLSEVLELVRKSMPRTYIRYMLAIRRVIKHIDISEIPKSRKQECMDMLVDKLTTEEHVLLLNWAFVYWPDMAERMRKYRLSDGVERGDLAAGCIYDFFNGESCQGGLAEKRMMIIKENRI